jgi:hypothetical protein
MDRAGGPYARQRRPSGRVSDVNDDLLLLGGSLAPITSEIGFIELPLSRAVESYSEWQRPIQEPLGRSLVMTSVNGTLEEVLSSLLPLVSIVPNRALFVPTVSSWTAFFSNGWRGTDAFPPMSYLAGKAGCRGLRVVAVRDSMDAAPTSRRSRYGALILELYGPRGEPLNYVRTISLVNDDGWSFDQSGTPFPFEDIANYSARKVRDRFTFSMLENYLTHLGLKPFEETFYLPAGTFAMLMEIHGPRPAGTHEYSLRAARGE